MNRLVFPFFPNPVQVQPLCTGSVPPFPQGHPGFLSPPPLRLFLLDSFTFFCVYSRASIQVPPPPSSITVSLPPVLHPVPQCSSAWRFPSCFFVGESLSQPPFSPASPPPSSCARKASSRPAFLIVGTHLLASSRMPVILHSSFLHRRYQRLFWLPAPPLMVP